MNALMKHSIGALTLTASLLGASAHAVAGSDRAPTGDGPSIHVHFADLDLSKPADAAILYQRIQSAARHVCTLSAAPWDGRKVTNWQRCYDGTVEEAVLRINRPLITAVHR